MAGALVVAASLTAASPALGINLGNGLRDAPDTGVCHTTPPALEATCTETQLQLRPGREAAGGLLSDRRGVVTSWQVASGPASTGTAGVRMRLRLLHGGSPVPSALMPFEALPLAEPGIHRFPARLPIGIDDELGLDLSVLGSALESGSAPIAHTEDGLGEAGEWVPPLTEARQSITNYLPDTELLLAARIEPDADRDEYGDVTQDRCSYDPRRQSACLPDGVAPRFSVEYDRRQGYIASGKAFLRVKPNELSQVIVSAQLETPTTTWGLYGDRAWVPAGRSEKLALRLPRRPRRSGKATLAAGGRAFIRCFLTVIDASGNRRHRTIRISPTGS